MSSTTKGRPPKCANETRSTLRSKAASAPPLTACQLTYPASRSAVMVREASSCDPTCAVRWWSCCDGAGVKAMRCRAGRPLSRARSSSRPAAIPRHVSSTACASEESPGDCSMSRVAVSTAFLFPIASISSRSMASVASSTLTTMAAQRSGVTAGRPSGVPHRRGNVAQCTLRRHRQRETAPSGQIRVGRCVA